MKIAFRSDASVELGSGHVMRCLTLADTLCERGAQVQFLCRREPGHLGDLIAAHGHALAWLPDRTDLDPQADAEASAVALATDAKWDWLVVDHYALGVEWEGHLRSVTRRIMVIDDLADRAHDCDLLLDQNLQEPGRYTSRVPPSCRTLIGPKYALLRPQFKRARQGMRTRDGHVSRLLVFFGGADASGETFKVLSAVDLLDHDAIVVDVVIGKANPRRAEIEAACAARPNVALYCQVDDMVARMVEADLFVGAGGTSSWERCCLGLPALVLATANNQVAQSEALAQAGAQLYLGLAQSVTTERLARLIEQSINLPEWLWHMAERGSSLVDGHGTGRVASHLLAAALHLRRALAIDCAALYAWRNHPDTRRYAFDRDEIDRQSHGRWFATVLANPDRALLIAEQGGQPVGVLRYDIKNGCALVSIYLVPGLSGQGWGLHLLLAGERWLRDNRPEVQVCEAEVATENVASLAVFQSAGFLPYRWTFRKDIHGSL